MNVVASSDYTQPGYYDMPATPQNVFLVICAVAALGMTVYALYLSVTRRSLVPALLPVAGFVAVLAEAPIDYMGNAVHSQVGQYTIYAVEGHPVPWGAALCYVAYVGLLPVIIFDRMKNQTMTPLTWWKAYGWILLSVWAVEQIPLHYQLWHYYGYHPFKIWQMPIHMVFTNATCVIMPALLIYKLYPILTGWRQLLTVGIIPAGFFAGWTSSGLLITDALGTDTETHQTIVRIAALGTVSLAILVTWSAISVVHMNSPATSSPPARLDSGQRGPAVVP